MDILKQLKENERPFGLMSEEMQEKAKEIGQSEFEMYMKTNEWLQCGDKNNFPQPIVNDQTYHLPPDYEEESVVRVPIEEEHGQLMYRGKAQIHKAVSDPDFIGFEVDDWIWGGWYKSKESGNVHRAIHKRDLELYEVLTPKFVLFRGKNG